MRNDEAKRDEEKMGERDEEKIQDKEGSNEKKGKER